MSRKQIKPRQDRCNIGHTPAKRPTAASISIEANFLNPDMPRDKLRRVALQAGMYNARKQRRATNG